MATPNIIDFPAAYPATGLEGIIIAGINPTSTVVQLICVNKETASRTLSLHFSGLPAFLPRTATATILDGNGSALRMETGAVDRAAGYVREIPARSVMLLRLQ